ncbi:MAG: hypothetical protein RL434_1547 [Pseudomonadota bacterium]
MDSLLFLCHRLPYPPNKGDKIRSWHFLQHLAGRYRIHLGTFIDDPDDDQYRDFVASHCVDLYAPRLDPRRRKLASLQGLLTGEALSLPYYRNSGMLAWVNKVLAEVRPQRIFVFSSAMGQYLPTQTGQARTVVDFVDVDSEKWRAYAASTAWPARLLYRREADRLLAWEGTLAARADASLFVSRQEAELFNSLLPRPLSGVAHVDNGVDLEYFRPDPALPPPFAGQAKSLVFTGAMDYWANVDAVTWFASDAWPRVRSKVPDAEFWIVGARPHPRVRALDGQEGIRVTGTVPDVRPYLQHADAVVAPLRIARGIQNKVLEAMAMDKSVVGTRAAFEGIAASDSTSLHTEDDPLAFAEACCRLLHSRSASAGEARAQVRKSHAWATKLARLDALLEA